MQIKKSYLEVLNLFRKDIFLDKTIRELSFLAKKDYPTIYNAVKELFNKKILKIKKIGNSKICEFSFSPEAISLISFLDEQEAFYVKIPGMEKILESEEFSEDIILVTGDYAKKKITKNSDINLVVITKEEAIKKQKLLENLTGLFSPRFHITVITQKDFIDMLLEKKENFGKEIFQHRLLLRNALRFYGLIKKAVENGFRG